MTISSTISLTKIQIDFHKVNLIELKSYSTNRCDKSISTTLYHKWLLTNYEKISFLQGTRVCFNHRNPNIYR